jgi:hypothetical protein
MAEKDIFSNKLSSIQNLTLLFTDNDSSHTALSSYNFCEDNGITVVCVPPHMSHTLQPLDVYFLGVLSQLKAMNVDSS